MSDAADELYGLPLEEFVPARDALVRELRAAGRRDEGKAVAALRKPSVAAWAANQAVRSQPKAARELWAAGDGLLAAHQDVIARRAGGDALRAATARHRAALRELLAAASGLLDGRGRGLSATTLERVEATLYAVSLDAESREAAEEGRLEREERRVGAF
ncbi:MAG: hypothetical protein E6G10_04740 [Actinobacteria bacterium]|nr:MAG: hypothetical protein E6G10_04740 [Actinomycetota bacterium]